MRAASRLAALAAFTVVCAVLAAATAITSVATDYDSWEPVAATGLLAVLDAVALAIAVTIYRDRDRPATDDDVDESGLTSARTCALFILIGAVAAVLALAGMLTALFTGSDSWMLGTAVGTLAGVAVLAGAIAYNIHPHPPGE